MSKPLKFVMIFILSTLSANLLAGSKPPSDYTKTKHPIVLVHGSPGGIKLPFVGFLGVDYFHDIAKRLKDGGAKVYTIEYDTSNTWEEQGKELKAHLDRLSKDKDGVTKFNLFGHSNGATVSRWVAHHHPGLVASVVSIGGRNRVDPSRPANDFEAARQFNIDHPAGLPPKDNICEAGDKVVNGVYYLSWSGTRTFKNSNIVDPMDLLIRTELVLSFEPPPLGAHDGAVGRCESHLGKIIRDDYKMNHMDEVNQLLGIVHPTFTSKPTAVHRMVANYLKRQGL